jgi:hypothetical protein
MSKPTNRTKLVLVHATDKPEVLFAPTGSPDRELEWYFTMAESDMGVRSNYMAMIRQAGDDSLDTCAEAARAQTRVTKWLTALGDHDAGVLKAAYVARPWGLVFREAFGRATGVIVRLAAAEVGLPDDDAELDRLEIRTAERLSAIFRSRGARGIEPHRTKALALLQRAYGSYVRQRGGSEKPPTWEGA